MAALQEKSLERPRWGDESSDEEEEEDLFLRDLKEKAAKMNAGELQCGVEGDDFIPDDTNGFLETVSVSKDEKPVVDPRFASDDSSKEKKPRRRKFEKSDSQTQKGCASKGVQSKGDAPKGKFPVRRSTKHVSTKSKDTQKRLPVPDEEQFFSFNAFINVERNTQEAILAMINHRKVIEEVCKRTGLHEDLVFHVNTILPPNPDRSKFAIVHNISFRYLWSKCSPQLRAFIKALNVRGGKRMIEFSGDLNGEHISVEVPLQKCLPKFQRTPQTKDTIKVSNVPLFRMRLAQETVFRTSADLEKFIGLPPSTICFYTSYKTRFNNQDFVYFIIRPSKLSDEDIAPIVQSLQENMDENTPVCEGLRKTWVDVLLEH